MRILLTGANGLLGQRVLKYALEQDLDILATSKGESRLYNLENVKYQSLDISNKEELSALINEYKPDAILNTAALTHVDHCEDNKELAKAVNVQAVQYLCELCSEKDIYLCHISTDFIFDGQKGIYHEDDEPNPVNFYGETKLQAEQVIKSHSNLNYSILRTILVFGFVPNLTRTNIVLWLNETLAAGKQVSMVTDQFRMPTFADDLAIASLSACSKKVKGVINVSGPEYLSVYDLAELLADVFGHDKSAISKAESVAFSDKAPRPPKTGFDLTKAKELLDYNPHSLREALELTKLQIQDFRK